MKPHSERWCTVWYVCGEYERADEPDRQLLEDMGFKWPTAGLLQMAIWDEMKEYGVDQNTISYSSLLSRWQLARHREVRLRKQQGERGPRRRNARRRVAALRGGALQPRRVRPARAGSAGATAPDVTAASLQRLMYGCLAVRDHVLLRVILFGTYHHHLSPLGGARGR